MHGMIHPSTCPQTPKKHMTDLSQNIKLTAENKT
jgi:hypothetical protein